MYYSLENKEGQSRYDRAYIRKVSLLTISVEMKEVFGHIQIYEHEQSSSSSDDTGRQINLLFQSISKNLSGFGKSYPGEGEKKSMSYRREMPLLLGRVIGWRSIVPWIGHKIEIKRV